ncbi:MAG TPA: TRAP transporter substrate-binding protein [Alphaproteobacteria bacterium]
MPRRSIALMAGAALAAMTATADATTWDLPTGYPDGVFHTANVKQFAEEVKRATAGALEIRVQAGATMMKLPAIKAAVADGKVPIGEILLSVHAAENPVFAVDSIPFLAASYDEAKRLWAASRAATEAALKRQGLAILYVVPWPPQGIYTKKALATLDDLKGVKFRAYNPITTKLANLVGAVPTTIEAADVPKAFTEGRIEAMISSASSGAHGKSWEYLSHYYATQAWLPKNAVIVNIAAWEKLDAAAQKAVTEAARAAEARGWAASAAEDEARKDVLRKNGVKVEKPTQALQDAFKKIGAEMAADWSKAAGAEGEAILRAYRQ